MSQSLAIAIIHLVFSTKGRIPLIVPAIRPDLHSYLAATVRSTGCECYRVGGVADHVHLAIRLSREISIAKLVEEVKHPRRSG